MQKLVLKAIKESNDLVGKSNFKLYEIRQTIDKLYKKVRDDLISIDRVLTTLSSSPDDLTGKADAIELLTNTRKERCNDIDTFRKLLDEIDAGESHLNDASSWLCQIFKDNET